MKHLVKLWQIYSIVPVLLLSFLLLTGGSAVAGDKERDKKTPPKEEGKLGDFEDEVGKGGDEDDHDATGQAFAAFEDYYFLARLTYGLLIQFPGETRQLYHGSIHNSYFSEYPYAVPDVGYFSQTDGKKFSVSFSTHYFYSESDLHGTGFRARLSPLPLFSAEVHFTNLTEELTTRNDHLQLYSVFVNYNRFRLNRLGVRWGIGLKGLRGDNTHNGFAFNLGGEWYLQKPLSLQFSYSGGWIGERFLPEFFGTLNVHVNRAAVFVGYQYWSAGGAVMDGVAVGVKGYF